MEQENGTQNELERYTLTPTQEKHNNRCSLKSRFKTKEKRFPCSISDHRFVRRSNLKTHTKAKPTCSMCTHQCSQKGSLKVHIAVYTKDKSFVCSICDCRFSQKSGLRKHMSVHTKISFRVQLVITSVMWNPLLKSKWLHMQMRNPIRALFVITAAPIKVI